MRTTLIRLAVALATFGLGVGLASIWLAGTSNHTRSYKRESCRWRERRAVLAPLPPPPPAPAVVVRDVPAPVAAPIAPVPPAVETLRMETCEGSAGGRTVAGGILIGKSISTPAPPYPAIAKAARASGQVVVEITVDECGEVEEARAVSGHPLLRAAAEEAAREARFAPTRIKGEPVKVTGTMAYSFAL